MNSAQARKSNVFTDIVVFFKTLTSNEGVTIDTKVEREVKQIEKIQKGQGDYLDKLEKTVGTANIALDKVKSIQQVKVDEKKAIENVEAKGQVEIEENEKQ